MNVALYEFVVFSFQFFQLVVDLLVIVQQLGCDVCSAIGESLQLIHNIDDFVDVLTWILFTFP